MPVNEIDTLNRHMVGVQGERVMILRPPRAPLSKVEALTFAAWIVAMADCVDVEQTEPTFADVLKAVENT